MTTRVLALRSVPWPATMGCNETAKWQPQIDAWPCAHCGSRRDAHREDRIPVCECFHRVIASCADGGSYAEATHG